MYIAKAAKSLTINICVPKTAQSKFKQFPPSEKTCASILSFFSARALIPNASFTSHSQLSSVPTVRSAGSRRLSWNCKTAVPCSLSSFCGFEKQISLTSDNHKLDRVGRSKIPVMVDVHVHAVVSLMGIPRHAWVCTHVGMCGGPPRKSSIVLTDK